MIFKDWINHRLKEVGKTWNDLTKGGVGGQTLYNIQHGKYRSMKEGTMQKIALVLGVCMGDVKDAIQKSVQEEVKNSVAAPSVTEKEKNEDLAEPDEPENIPFSDEQEQKEDVKWYQDRLKQEASVEPRKEIPEIPETKLNVLDEAGRNIAKALEGFTEAAANAMQAIVEGKTLGICLEDESSPDPVNHPSHYTQGGIECIEAIEASMVTDAFKGFLKGNVMKYLWRYEIKGGAEDLHKAKWYLERLIEEVEAGDD